MVYIHAKISIPKPDIMSHRKSENKFQMNVLPYCTMDKRKAFMLHLDLYAAFGCIINFQILQRLTEFNRANDSKFANKFLTIT